jgi:hypothetical protein
VLQYCTSMATSAKLSKETSACLKRLKDELGLSSVDDVIQHLCKEHDGNGGQDGARAKSGSEMDEEDEDVESAKLAPGVLRASVGGDPKSVKHFTGLKKGSFKWVMISRRRYVSFVFFVLFVSCLSLHDRDVLSV